MKTLAVMCMALHSTRPSVTPLVLTAASTCGVMLTKPTREGRGNVRDSVCDFIVLPRPTRRRHADDQTTEASPGSCRTTSEPPCRGRFAILSGMNQAKRILIVGHGRAGKDTACEFLAEVTTLRFAGT